MKHQTLLQHKDGRVALVGNGFSWAAFFFGPLWAVVKRQWMLGLLLFLVLIPINFLIEFAEATRNLAFILASLGLMIGYMVSCGIYGNRWLKASLKRKGYVESANA
jgi:hypothetical protein